MIIAPMMPCLSSIHRSIGQSNEKRIDWMTKKTPNTHVYNGLGN